MTRRFSRIARLTAVLAPAIVLLLAPSRASAGESVRVLEVYDADTIRVERAGGDKATVRLIGVDAPEIDGKYRHAELGGRAAAAFARELMPPGPVTLEADDGGDDVDRYGRLLRYVRLADGRDAGAEIIAAGYAESYRRFDYSRKESYAALEAQAKAAGRGLWGEHAGE